MSDKQKKIRFTIGKKMYLFVILTVLAAAFGVAILSYFINVGQIDRYFKRLAKNSAKNFASQVDADFLQRLADAAASDEFQQLRDECEENEDEAPVEEYLREKGLWDEYADTRSKLNVYLENMDDIKYLYIIQWGDKNADHDMYLIDDYENPIYETGYYEEREPEFFGADPEADIEPTISNGDWGWLCSAYYPVRDADGKLVCHIGVDIGMEDIMAERSQNLLYVMLSAVGLTAVILAFAVLFTNKVVIRPLNRITADMKKFTPGENKSYRQAGVIDLDIKSNDEIEDIYEGIHSMQVNIIDYLSDISVMQKDKEKAENDVRDKDEVIGQISKEVYRDPLTSVGNKAAYIKKLEELKKEIEGGDTDFALVMVDINELKTINDSYGHNAGDIYIKGCCHVICQIYKHSPVYRVGGDEFVVVLRGEDYKNRYALFEELRTNYEKSGIRADVDAWLKYSAASGMAEYSFEDNTVELVFKRADKAMYENKLEYKRKHGYKR